MGRGSGSVCADHGGLGQRCTVPAWLDLARQLIEPAAQSAADGAATLRLGASAPVPRHRGARQPSDGRPRCRRAVGPRCREASRWALDESAVADPAATVTFTADAAWRSFTGAAVPRDGIARSGPRELTESVLDVRAACDASERSARCVTPLPKRLFVPTAVSTRSRSFWKLDPGSASWCSGSRFAYGPSGNAM